MYKVYIKTDWDNRVIAVNSDAFLTYPIETPWVQIDEGDGDRFHHAQGNYLDKPLMTIQGIYQYKLVEGIVVERTVEEIDADIAALPPPPPTIEEKVVQAERKFTAMKPLITELVQDKPADIVIGLSEFILDWKQGNYIIGNVRMYDGQPRTCCQAHDSTNNPDWTPSVASLWAPYHATTEELTLPWIIPTGAHDMYKVGEFMLFTDEKIYKCVEDTNFSPTEYAAAWHIKQADGSFAAIVTEEPVEEPPIEEPPVELNSNGTVVWSEWVVWDGYNEHLYQTGDRVTYNTIRYTATAGDNHWAPDIYGWIIS